MAQPRSSLAMALEFYKGPRPGISLTVAAIALIAALVVGVFHIIGLGKAGTIINESQQTVRTLHTYNAALEVWREMATTPDTAFSFPEQLRLRDSLGVALQGHLAGLRDELADEVDRSLVTDILNDMQQVQEEAGEGALGQTTRESMIVLTARQDSALFEAAQEYQKSQFLAAWLLGLTIVAAGVLVIPISWVYVNFKRGMPNL